MKRRKDIFNFNHIDTKRKEEEIDELKKIYKYYHRLAWCYKKSFKRAKLLDHSIEYFGIFLVFVGTVIGGITLNPIIFGVLNGLGLSLASIGKLKNYKRKAEMAKIAFAICEKVLAELRAALRGNEFDETGFLSKMEALDGMIIDQTPLADRYEKMYSEKFG